MMEFTFDGIVRYGFGFYNPNHAAALICAIIPLFWGWKRCTWLGWGLSLLFVIPLVMTYSRTGMLVLFFEIIMYFILTNTKNWKLILSIISGMVLIALVGGIFARFSIDKALTNRPEIWIAGLKLSAVNPMGVGLGNSGLLASTFLLDGITCRTLINSHLTLLAEFGMPIGFAWISCIIYSLIAGIRKVRTWCAFSGLVLSASAASIFDWDMLFDWHEHGNLPETNYYLSWGMLGFFVCLFLLLIWRHPLWKNIVVAGGVSLLLFCCIFCFYDKNAPCIKNELIVKTGTEMPLVLYDDTWTIKTILPFMKDGYKIPLSPQKTVIDTESVWLFGNAAEYEGDFKNSMLIFVSPSEFYPFPENTQKIYLKRFKEDYNLDFETVFY